MNPPSLLLFVSLSVFGACSDHADPPTTYPGTLIVGGPADSEDTVACTEADDYQCPDPATSCYALDEGSFCLKPEEACSAIECGPEGQCEVLESWPLQLLCSSTYNQAPTVACTEGDGYQCSGNTECYGLDEGTFCLTTEQACSAIGCSLEACLVQESWPLRVACWEE